MITINLAGIYLFLCKLSATILLISIATFGFLMVASVDVENDESVLGFFAYIVAAAGIASFAMLIILFLVFVIYEIWKL